MDSKKRRLMSAVAVSAFLTVIFTGCVLDSQKTLETGTVEPTVMTSEEVKATNVLKSEKEQMVVLKTFDSLVQSNSSLDGVVDFVDNNIKQLSKNKATQLVLDLETYQRAYIKRYQSEIVSMNQRGLFDANGVLLHTSVMALPEGHMKNLLLHLEDSGLKIKHGQDLDELVIDYGKLKLSYSECTTLMMQDYLKIRSLESEKPCFSDRSLVITWQELLDRMQGCEEFILAYPDFKQTETVKVMYFTYFKAFIYGGEGTPVFSAEDGHILDDVVVVYQNMKMNEQNAISMKYLKNYFNVVQKSKFRYSEQVDSVRKQITNELKQELKVTTGSLKDLDL